MKSSFTLTVIGAALISGLAGCSSQKEVPLLEGMDAKEAQTRIVQLGFQVGRIDNEFSGQKDCGKVLRQQPAASTRADKGTTIHLVVEESVTMPDLSGMDADSAARTIGGLSLRLQKVEKKAIGGQTPGAVVGQVPAAGERIAPRSAVNLVVDDYVVVPDFTGEAYDSIRKTLTQSGLTLGKKYYKVSTEKTGTILDQIPDAGAKVARDTAVQFELSQAAPATASRNGAATEDGRNHNPFETTPTTVPDKKPKKDIGDAVGNAVGNAISNAIGELIDGKGKPKNKPPGPSPEPGDSDYSGTTNNVAPKTPAKKGLEGFIGRLLK